MRWLRSAFSALLLSLALSLGYAALSPTEARAEWVQWGGLRYMYVSTSMPTTFKVAPTNASYTAYTNLILPGQYVQGSSTATGTVWNTVPSGNVYLISMQNVPDGTLAEGAVIKLQGGGTITIDYVTSTPTNYDAYSRKNVNATNYRYFVSKSGNTDTTEIFANDKGVFVMPFTAQYIFCVCTVNFSLPSGTMYWYRPGYMTISYERPEDQNEVAAINDQTQVLTNTTGSDTVTGDTTTQYTQQIENLSLIQGLEGIQQQLHEALTTTESDTTVVFPGVNLMGFTIPSYEIDPLAVSPIPPDTIRGFLTFVFVCWYIAYMRNLVANIFNLRWYNYDGEIYDEGTRTGWDYADENWGLVE